MSEKFMGVHVEEQVPNELKKIALKENLKLKELHKKILLDYIKKHGDGNPAYTMDNFIESKNMKAIPAVFRDRDYWQEYIEKLPKKEVQELLWQIQTIHSLTDKKFNYETTQVKIY